MRRGGGLFQSYILPSGKATRHYMEIRHMILGEKAINRVKERTYFEYQIKARNINKFFIRLRDV